MKAALLLRGISYMENYKGNMIDFRMNFDNFQSTIINSLQNIGFDVDTYYTTYKHEYTDELEFMFKPKKTLYTQYTLQHNDKYVINGMKTVLDLVSDKYQEYDIIIMTRFDILLKDYWNNVFKNIDIFGNIVFCSFASSDNRQNVYTDDNIIIVPSMLYKSFYEVIDQFSKIQGRLLHHLLYQKLLQNNIPTIVLDKNSYEIAKQRSFYLFNREIKDIKRNLTGIVLNEHELIPHIQYTTQNLATLIKTAENEVIFYKPAINTYIPCSWFGLNFVPTKICMRISFDILFLSEVPKQCERFHLRVHHPFTEYDNWLNNCERNIWTHIEIDVEFVKGQKQFVIFIADQYNKLVHFKLRNFNIIDNIKTLRFVSFYTEGPPHDEALNIVESKNIYENAIRPYVDTIRFWNAREFKNGTDEMKLMVKKFDIESRENIGTHAIGFLRWKPWIILKELESANDGDIIYYRDCNVIKYRCILEHIENTYKNCEYVLRDTDIFSPIDDYPRLKVRHNVKSEAVKGITGIDDLNHEIYNEFLSNASLFICRKTDRSIDFVKRWLDLCMDDELLTYRCDRAKQGKDFLWNTQEQSILNILLYQYNIRPKIGFDRRFRIDTMKRAVRVAVLVAGEMRNYFNKDLLASNLKHLFDLYNCDLFVSTWSKCGYSPYHGQQYNKQYSHNIVQQSNLESVYGRFLKKSNIEDYENWLNKLKDSKSRIYNGILGNKKIWPATSYPQFYKLWDANRLKQDYENENNFKYDVVIRFRPDMFLIEKIPDKYIHPLLSLNPSDGMNKLWHINNKKNYYPNRVYDIFFYGNNDVMNIMCDLWNHIEELINHPFNNNLPPADSCRLLYVHAKIMHNLEVIDMDRCIGEVYRDEYPNDFIGKVKNVFN